MEWTNEKTVELIEVYKAKRVLWDPKNPKYCNKFANNDAWTELADILEADEDCKKMMLSLLSSLRRGKAKVSNSQRTGKGIIALMAWFEILKWY
jgi:hypothetical protein